MILLSSASVSDWVDLGPGFLIEGIGKLMTYLSAQKQTSKNNGRGSAPGRELSVAMVIFE